MTDQIKMEVPQITLTVVKAGETIESKYGLAKNFVKAQKLIEDLRVGDEDTVTITEIIADVEHAIISGTGKEVKELLAQRVVTIEGVSALLIQTLSFLTEWSDLKVGMVTLVAGDGKAGGMGVYNDRIEVTDEDITIFLAAAEGHNSEFRHQMSKIHPNVVQPLSNIVMPTNEEVEAIKNKK